MDTNGSVHCKHGPGECLGDIIALCAGDLHPEDPIISLGFSNCLVSSYSEIPSLDLVEPCAIEHGLSFDDLNACISEYGKGLDLLQKSVERSQAAGVTKSCTVRLANKIWCIRDGGEWKECKHGSGVGSLVEEVKRVYGD